jgi:hypothetical protein
MPSMLLFFIISLFFVIPNVHSLVISNELRRLQTNGNQLFHPVMYYYYTPNPPPPNSRKINPLQLSPSVISSCDDDIGLPDFHTAHGLLSPETVLRLERSSTDHKSPALKKFLTTYRENGPMSCLCLLSDPDILPHLTTAMRDLM